MKTLLLDCHALSELVSRVGLDEIMDRTIERLTDAFRLYGARYPTPPERSGFFFHEPHFGLLEWMPYFQAEEGTTIKVVGYCPSNPKRSNRPSVVSTISQYDHENGHLVVIADAVYLTAVRTGAASAIASSFLAHSESTVLGVVGAGAQAITQAHALSRRFRLREILVYDIDPAVAASFSQRAYFLRSMIRVAPLATLEREADILCTATSVPVGGGTVISGKGLQPHIHINAVGSDFPGKTELPKALLERSLVCPDFIPQARKEGECQQLLPEFIGPELAHVVQHPGEYSEWKNRATVFDSTGFALEDHVVLQIAVELARELELGEEVQIESTLGDPYNPYELATPVDGSERRSDWRQMSSK